MKKLGILMLVLLFVGGTSFAQERGEGKRPSKTTEQGRTQASPEEMMKKQTAKLVADLKLNKDQEAKITAINKKYMDKQSADFSKMKDASDAERTKMREARNAVQAEKDKEIKAVLTKEQVKLYEEMQKKREEARKSGQGRSGGQRQ